jgi:hypothetical protein
MLQRGDGWRRRKHPSRENGSILGSRIFSRRGLFPHLEERKNLLRIFRVVFESMGDEEPEASKRIQAADLHHDVNKLAADFVQETDAYGVDGKGRRRFQVIWGHLWER